MPIVINKSGNDPDNSWAELNPSILADGVNTGAQAFPAKRWPGGRGTLTVVGTFGGSTVRLQFQAGDNSTWLDADTTNASFTAAGMCGFELGAGLIRLNAVGGAPSALIAKVSQAKRTMGG